MMKINKLNYENYVIDYIEGSLSSDMKKDFDLFLEKHKEVYDEIKDYMSAPILEEPTVVFHDKKTILRKSSTAKYALLALIPILLAGIYLINIYGSEKTGETNEIVEEMIAPTKMTAEEKTEEIKKVEIETVVPSVEIKEEVKIEEKKTESELKKNETKKTQNKIEPTLKKENFDLKEISKPSKNEMNFAATEAPKNIGEPMGQPTRATINSPIQIGNMKMNFEFGSTDLPSTNMVLAEVETSNKGEENLRDQLSNKNNWLEMITPAAFDDIDLKESLAIQSLEKGSAKRKILNAFIPESFVK